MTQKRTFADLTLKEVMQSVVEQDIRPWDINPQKREPSDTLKEYLRRCFQSFDLSSNEGKILLIDALLMEVVPLHPRLKIWKDAPQETESAAGIVDYLIAPKRAYLDTPLICVTLARRDAFDDARVECMAQMAACRHNNGRDGFYSDIYGIVSNGQGWVFYLLIRSGAFLESGYYTIENLPALLGAIDNACVCSAHNALMSRNIPDSDEKVTLRFFFPEELHLMRNCLIAATEEIYATDNELKTLTNTSRDEYAALLSDFGTMTKIGNDNWQMIVGLIGMLVGYPVDNGDRLWAFLGVSWLHLSWFCERVLHVKEHWPYYVEVSTKEVHARAEWLTPIDELVRPLNR